MTEYDYSPQAYERFMATQKRIGRWVEETQNYLPINPFVPSVSSSQDEDYFAEQHHNDRTRGLGLSSSTSTIERERRPRGHIIRDPKEFEPRSSYRRSRSHHHGSRSQPSHSSSQTHTSHLGQMYVPTTSRMDYEGLHHHYYHSSHPNDQHHHSRTSSKSRSRSHSNPSRSTSRTNSSNQPSSYASAHGKVIPYSTVYPDPNSPTIINPSSYDPIVVPIEGGLGGYVVVPPNGTRMEVVSPESYTYEEETGQSFFRRLFHGFRSSSNHSSHRRKRH